MNTTIRSKPIKKKPIVASRKYAVDDLPRELIHKLYKILCQVFGGYSRSYFEQHILRRAGETQVKVLYGANQQVAGFISYGVEQHNIGDEIHAIFDGGVVVDLDYSGGSQALALTAFGFALQYKLRHPTHKLGAFLKATTPIMYHHLASVGPVFPHPDNPTPPSTLALIQELSRQRGYDCSEENPWLFPAPKNVKFLHGHRLHKHCNSKYKEFFLQQNPGYLDGDLLLVYMPLDFLSMTHSIWTTLKRSTSFFSHRFKK
ncbi:MAG: hypothetical protein EP343_08955 [Deltaproteobacteria bacterium]|nr:MAG: hypothetical protein EP343_08955 [Deltaproteobacteria bacterium]